MQRYAERAGDIRKFKEIALKHLKPGSALRDLILSEPDFLPREEAGTKTVMYYDMIVKELGKA